MTEADIQGTYVISHIIIEVIVHPTGNTEINIIIKITLLIEVEVTS